MSLAINTIISVAFLVSGLVFNLVGQRIFRPVLAVAGFLGGFGVTFHGVHDLAHKGEMVSVLAGLAAGIVLAIAVYMLFHLGIFCAGGALGALVAGIITTAEYHGELVVSAKGAVIATYVVVTIVLGIIALFMVNPALILTTSVLGAYAFCCAIRGFVEGETNPYLYYRNPQKFFDMNTFGEDGHEAVTALVILFPVLAVVGLIIQTRSYLQNREEEEGLMMSEERYAYKQSLLPTHHQPTYYHNNNTGPSQGTGTYGYSYPKARESNGGYSRY
eukprot:GFYU01000045.1.p1 GENE.GFYU01000045.1~~GFYU01000045.1.p1  ORF type:complete len:274 (+),score=81.40 GFYU01000045.1:92-913(+)